VAYSIGRTFARINICLSVKKHIFQNCCNSSSEFETHYGHFVLVGINIYQFIIKKYIL